MVEALGGVTYGSPARVGEQDQHHCLAVLLLGYFVEQLLEKVRFSNRLNQEYHVLNDVLYARELFDQVHAHVVQRVQRTTKREDKLVVLDAQAVQLHHDRRRVRTETEHRRIDKVLIARGNQHVVIRVKITGQVEGGLELECQVADC